MRHLAPPPQAEESRCDHCLPPLAAQPAQSAQTAAQQQHRSHPNGQLGRRATAAQVPQPQKYGALPVAPAQFHGGSCCSAQGGQPAGGQQPLAQKRSQPATPLAVVKLENAFIVINFQRLKRKNGIIRGAGR